MAAPVGGIAVVGAGPGGLLAAIHLPNMGEKVTVCVAYSSAFYWPTDVGCVVLDLDRYCLVGIFAGLTLG